MRTPQSAREGLAKIRLALETAGVCRLTVTGSSMVPFLREGRDAVLLAPLDRPARRGDILFYLRGPETPILHRVHRVEADGRLLLCGDAQVGLEPVSQEQILALVTHIDRAGRQIPCGSLWLRSRVALWQLLRPVRPWLMALIRKCS